MASDADRIQFLTGPPSCETAQLGLLPDLRAWFASAHGAPTEGQRHAWPAIGRGQHLLLSSPTGTGKTLAAFMPILSELLESAQPGLRCLHIAPLKALCRDVRNNLQRTWREIQRAGYFPAANIRFGLRTGDTSQRLRQSQLHAPPEILMTTPESLAQMLARSDWHEHLRGLRWVIIDEIHALAGSKRGADLALSLERLADMNSCPGAPQRIGLSATCTPLSAVAQFLAGAERPCTVAQVQDTSTKQFIIEPLDEKLAYSPNWMAILLDRLDSELATQRTTLIFTNTRNLAERLTWALRRRYPARSEEIGVHHSSLSAARRRIVERRLKQGRLWTVVSSASLELGIDIGTVDSVVFVHPPGGVVRLLQRVGRSGHGPHQPRRGVLLTATPSELLESAVTASGGRDGHIEAVRIIDQPLDVLCQQVAGMAITGLWSPAAAYALIRGAAPFRNLAWQDFNDCLDYLSGRRRDGTLWLTARLHWEDGCFTIASPAVARLLRCNLGTILTDDVCTIRLRVSAEVNQEPQTHMLGELDSVYAERLQPGDRFVLDGRCLELKERDSSDLLVDEVFGRPLIPRWHGSSVPMPVELARRIYVFRVQAAEALRDGDADFRAFLQRDLHLDDSAIAALTRYFLHQETVSEIPTLTTLLIECVSMQSCQEYFVHTPLPRTANETLARVLMQRWKQTNRAPMLASASDLGMYFLIGSSAPTSVGAWRDSLSAERFSEDFQCHLRAGDLLRQHFARIAQTGLLMLRHRFGRQSRRGVTDWTARRLYDQLRDSAADFVLLRQTENEAHHGLCDLATAQAFAESLPAMSIRLRHLREPSPLGESLARIAISG